MWVLWMRLYLYLGWLRLSYFYYYFELYWVGALGFGLVGEFGVWFWVFGVCDFEVFGVCDFGFSGCVDFGVFSFSR